MSCTCNSGSAILVRSGFLKLSYNVLKLTVGRLQNVFDQYEYDSCNDLSKQTINKLQQNNILDSVLKVMISLEQCLRCLGKTKMEFFKEAGLSYLFSGKDQLKSFFEIFIYVGTVAEDSNKRLKKGTLDSFIGKVEALLDVLAIYYPDY